MLRALKLRELQCVFKTLRFTFPERMKERREKLPRVMVITEKPSAAKRIATALDAAKSPEEIKKGKVTYYACRRGI